MGQYYHVITEDKDGKREYFNIQTRAFREAELKGKLVFGLYNGLKLMEHSWWRNNFCTALAQKIVDKPKRVCWVGDYAEEEECAELGFTSDEVWKMDKEDYTYLEDTKFEMNSVKYLINNSKKCYVDLEEYFKESNRPEELDGCIFPISLLTALGNGRGGGDYLKDNEMVGAWAFDEIYLTNNLPQDYEKIDVCFVED